MALQLDATAFGALTKLLDKVTDKHESHQDAVALQQIKAFCKQSDENITWLSTVLLHRLKEDHAQVLHNTFLLITPKLQVVYFANTTGPSLSLKLPRPLLRNCPVCWIEVVLGSVQTLLSVVKSRGS